MSKPIHHLRRRLAQALASLLLACLTVPALAQEVEGSLAPHVLDGPSELSGMVMDTAQRALIWGMFNSVDGNTGRRSIIRVLGDHRIDPAFLQPVIADNELVTGVVVQRAGGYLMASRIDMPGAVGVKLVRLLDTGEPDPAFSVNIDIAQVIGFPWAVSAAEQRVASGQPGIYIAGPMVTVNGQPRTRLARLHADGSLDTGFNPVLPDEPIYENRAILALADGGVLLSEVHDISSPSGYQAPLRVRRFDADGALVFTFDTLPPAEYQQRQGGLLEQSDGKLLIAGRFPGVVGGPTRAGIVRLHPDGSIDSDFQVPTEALVPDFATPRLYGLQDDGRILMASAGLTRLLHDGSIDPLTPPHVPQVARTTLDTGNGTWLASLTVSGNNHLLRRTEHGRFDSALMPAISGNIGGVHSATLQHDGVLLAAGSFTEVDGQPRQRLARFLPDAALDPDYSPSANNIVHTLLDEGDGVHLIGGAFTTLNTQPVARLARLRADGTLLATFNAQIGNGEVRALARQADGKILVGGSFTQVGGQTRQRLTRLLSSGVLDPAFAAITINGPVNTLALQRDGRIVIGGDFFTVDGQLHAGVARLNADGSVDHGFNAQVDGSVNALSIGNHGRIAVGGDFFDANGQSRSHLAILEANGSNSAMVTPLADAPVHTLTWLDDGGLLVGGAFNQIAGLARGGVARINPNGIISPALNAPVGGPAPLVRTLSMQFDGRLVIGGEFTTVKGAPRTALARLTSKQFTLHRPEYRVGQSQVVWHRSADQPAPLTPPEVWVSLDCCNDINFVPLPGGHQMQQVDGTWVLNGFPGDIAERQYIQIRARVGSSQASTELRSPIHEALFDDTGPGSDRLFANGFEMP